MSFQLPELPYARDALAPVISSETLEYHHDKHHAAYVANLNKLIADTEFSDMSLEDIIRHAPSGGIYNNAAQAWNHSFYFAGFSADGGGRPDGALALAIDTAFGSFDSFAEKVIASATGNFGSGWTWLVQAGGGLEIVNTANAGNPLTDGKTPLLTIDVWEHAYYIDYRNARPKYLQAIWDIVDWNIVGERFNKLS
jgi:Fe-Mn family superoxide dismutase